MEDQAASVANQNAELARLKVIAPVFLTTCGITVILRIFTRARILKHIGPDDWSILAALGVFAAYIAVFYNTIHIQTLVFSGSQAYSFLDIIVMAKWINGLYGACVIAVKISVAFFMVRLYGPNNVWQRWTVIISTIILTLMGIVFVVMSLVSCGVGSRSNADCPMNSAYTAISYTYFLLNTVVDVLFAVMSVLLVTSISISGVAAFSTGVLLVIGTIGGIASAMRCAVILGWHGPDQAVTNLVIGRWSMLEAGLTITAASMATLRPLLKKIQGLSTNSYGTTQGNPTSASRPDKTKGTVNHEMDETPFFQRGGEAEGDDKITASVSVQHVETRG
ncbi:hypothetical protein KVT40_000352 [Elsinoe batatas]|uniref:Rhodopsin domain-containing protein n=1 Tax=Elsinoe batatas TaxID=2601811 RepID=A0A8K0L954_9PEZI|nr:hypothetical protein KVT40_000352 [Elsinoe batatas]